METGFMESVRLQGDGQGTTLADSGTAGRPFGRSVEIAEVWVFLLLIVPSLVLSLFAVRQGTISFDLAAVATIFRDVALVCLILFFLWRNGEPVGRIGWKTNHWEREALIGLVLFPLAYVAAALAEWALLGLGFHGPATRLPSFLNAHGTWEYALALLLVAVVAWAEETIFRGYLLLRFARTTGSIALAVAVSTIVFTVGHGYEGSAGLLTVALLGFFLALVYLWRQSLVAPIVIHFLLDFVNIVLFPLLRR